MIFYFSGTGNSLMTARRIAEALGDEHIAITDILNGIRQMPRMSPDETIGLICPVYFFGLPDLVEKFISRLEPFADSRYVFGVLTYGTTTGMAASVMRHLLALRGIRLDAIFSVRMVDVWTPLFDLSDSSACLRRTEAAIPKIDSIINLIRAKAHESNPSLPSFFAPLGRKVYDAKRATRRFSLMSERCIGCGLCARGCPASAITMDDDRPHWTKDQCTLCLRCLHRCPSFAIQYGPRTASHGQFVNPFVNPRDF